MIFVFFDKREFNVMKSGRWTFMLRSYLSEASFVALCSLPSSVTPTGVRLVASSSGTEVRRITYQDKGYFLKEYFFISWKKHLKVLRRGEQLASISQKLEKHGFLTPKVVGFGRSGKSRRVVTEEVENALDIWQVLYPDFKHYRGPVDDGFIYAFGRTVGDLHRCGFFHGDLRWRNVLTRLDGTQWQFFFIDNDRTKRYRFGIPFHCRLKNLTQILFSGLLLNWPQSDWQVFLQGYFATSDLPQPVRDKLVARVEDKAQRRLAERKNREEQG